MRRGTIAFLLSIRTASGRDERVKGREVVGLVPLARLVISTAVAVGHGFRRVSCALKLCNGRAEGFDGFALYMVMDRGKAHHVVTGVGGAVFVAVGCRHAPLVEAGSLAFAPCLNAQPRK